MEEEICHVNVLGEVVLSLKHFRDSVLVGALDVGGVNGHLVS